jgi:hypothetical protein
LIPSNRGSWIQSISLYSIAFVRRFYVGLFDKLFKQIQICSASSNQFKIEKKMKMTSSFLFCIILTFVSRIVFASWTTAIPASEVSCFVESATLKAPILLQFQVILGGALDVDVEVFCVIGIILDSKSKWSDYLFCTTTK